MLKIFNTLTKKKETFKTIYKNTVNLYVCGVTVYDYCHIGHGRTFSVFDMIVRYLRCSGFQVKYVRNITDIDDKIILKSIKENIDVKILTDVMIRAMQKDFSLLGLSSPDLEPRVTEHIQDIIQIIQVLIKKKSAYVNAEGDVFFSIKNHSYYGELSRQSLTCMKHRSRSTLSHSVKKDELDFVLWKHSKKEKYSWESPWGKGRPGWHIECTALNHVFFNDCIDIHGGGTDLIFPHHENERAQSFGLNDRSKINFWIHSGMVIINNKKMSKSLGNVFLLKDILKNYNGEIIRYFFLSTHYRHPIYFCQKSLDQASSSLKILYTALYGLDCMSNTEEGIDLEHNFYEAMNDDFNTPKVFSMFIKTAHKINFFKKNNLIKAKKLAFKLRFLANHLGLLLQNPKDFLQNKFFLNISQINMINNLIEKRNIARKLKLWKEADDIRDQLMLLNIIVQDCPDTTTWYKKFNTDE